MSTPKKSKILWGRSGGKCAFPNCRKVLFEDEKETYDISIVGDEAHIVARETNGARGISDLTPEERDSHDNLILLCKVHHKQIDDQPNKYTVALLKKMKADHEHWVKNNEEASDKTTKPQSIKDILDKKRAITTNEKKLNTEEGVKILKEEIALINKGLKDDVDEMKKDYRVELRGNKFHLADISGYEYTLLIQFYPENYNSTEPSYIRVALFHCWFDTNGNLIGPGPVYPIFDKRHYCMFNEDGQFGWIEKDRKNTFCITEILLLPYIKKFMDYALSDQNRKRFI